MMQLSSVHSLVNELVRKGEITPEEALGTSAAHFLHLGVARACT
jgi:hypothetical protein